MRREDARSLSPRGGCTRRTHQCGRGACSSRRLADERAAIKTFTVTSRTEGAAWPRDSGSNRSFYRGWTRTALDFLITSIYFPVVINHQLGWRASKNSRRTRQYANCITIKYFRDRTYLALNDFILVGMSFRLGLINAIFSWTEKATFLTSSLH